MREMIERRNDLTERLVASLAHLDRDEALVVVSSWIALDTLKVVVDFQERKR